LKKIAMNMVDFLTKYGPRLVADILDRSKTLHTPGDPTIPLPLIRTPFEAQTDAIEGIGKVLDRSRTSLLNGAMGVGKTLMGIAIAVREHIVSGRTTTNVIVEAPPTLIEKWAREITISVSQGFVEFPLEDGTTMKIEVPFGSKVFNCSGSDAISKFQEMESGIHTGLCFWLIADTTVRRHYHTQRVVGTGGVVRHEEIEKFVSKRVIDAGGASCRNSDEAYLARCPKCGSFFKIKMREGQYRYLTIAELQNKRWIRCNAPRFNSWDPTNPHHDWRSTPPAEDKPRTCGEIFYTNVRNNEAPRSRFMESSLVTGTLANNRSSVVIESIEEEDDDLVSKPHAMSHCVSLAYYAKKKWRNSKRVHLLMVDEAHRAKNDGIHGETTRWLATTAQKVVFLTGTLTGGYARDLFYLLWSISYRELKARGYSYSDVGRFEAAYGSREVKELIRNDGKVARTPRKLPGICSEVYTDFLVSKTVFLDMSDLSLELPPMNEYLELVEMSEEMEERYTTLVKNFRAEMAKVARKDFKSLSGITSCAIHVWNSWLDRLRADKIAAKIDKGDGTHHEIEIEIEDLEIAVTPKEARIIELCQQNKDEGRKSMVFLTYTGERDCAERLLTRLEANGLKAVILRPKVAARKREAWIIKNTADCDVLITNPELVKEGLDLIQFPTIIDAQPITNLYTHRQAMARPYRPGQTKEVRLYYIGYRATVQEQLMALIASKLDSALLAEGDASDSALFEISYSQDSVLREMVKAVIAGQDDLLALTKLGKRQSTELKYAVDARTFAKNGGFVEDVETVEFTEITVETETKELVTVSESGEVKVVSFTVTRVVKIGKKVHYVTDVLSADDLASSTETMQLCLF
jgi:hypothetical protein